MKTQGKMYLIISFIFINSLNVEGQTPLEASEYMQDVTEKAFELDDETWKYLKAITRGKKPSKVEEKRRELP